MLTRFCVGVACVVASAGCYVHTDPEPVGYAEVTAAPAGIESSPHTTYEGHPVYWHDNRWYYQDNGNWRYYRQEPADLHRQRPYVQEAPPAQRGYAAPNGYAPPPAPPPAPYQNNPGYGGPPASAPPAVRVN